MKEIARFLGALLQRNDWLTSLPRIAVELLWGFQLLFFPFAAARVGSWFLVVETALLALWWYGQPRSRKTLWRWSGVPVVLAALLYTIWGRLDVACGYAVALYVALCGAAEWQARKKGEKFPQAVGVLCGLGAVIFAWKATVADFSDLAPVYAIFLLALGAYSALKLKISRIKP